jgi:membrane protease subunit (stomatin/prohibitin family)
VFQRRLEKQEAVALQFPTKSVTVKPVVQAALSAAGKQGGGAGIGSTGPTVECVTTTTQAMAATTNATSTTATAKWACLDCTLLNSAADGACDACGLGGPLASHSDDIRTTALSVI